MTAVADSSPLVILAKLACFDLLKRLFPRLYISTEVHHEVVVAGAGLPGAEEVARAEWIEVKQLRNQEGLAFGPHSTIMVNMVSPAIVSTRDILGGTPVFAGTRVPAQTLIDYLEAGDSIDEFLSDFPTVRREQVIEVLEAAKTQLLAAQP